ncbi:hypothetical protein AB0M80_21265 [Amycolatopsis sp. NPDC051045]|uniref:hypothetical protein n=1 Tax=Amycolatopsis sp. NPDC051045 TaxID=3156922 RepID=UPI00341A8D40
MERDDRPAVIPSPVDPDVECVRDDRPPGERPQPPGPTSAPPDEATRLCPDGYTPRRRSRGVYQLDGKRVVRDTPPQPHPDSDHEQ